jgi:predicted CopG family antitoxin
MVKTITIKESVYDELIKVKESDESFSDLFERLIGLIGAKETLKKMRGSVEIKDKKKIIEEIYSKRGEVRS